MRRMLLIPLFAWELIVLGFVALVMIMFGMSLNGENVRKLAMTALVGPVVALVCLPACRSLPRAAGWFVGSVIGLIVPPLFAWAWAGLLPIPNWTGPSEVKLVGLVLSIPSALGGMVVGGLQARSPRHLAVPS